MDLLLFGDQSTDYLPTFQALLKGHRGTILSEFFGSVNTALKLEIHALPDLKGYVFPSFSDIDELVSKYERSLSQNATLDSALLCLAQLSHFIW